MGYVNEILFPERDQKTGVPKFLLLTHAADPSKRRSVWSETKEMFWLAGYPLEKLDRLVKSYIEQNREAMSAMGFGGEIANLEMFGVLEKSNGGA